jgi:hypothetical protein
MKRKSIYLFLALLLPGLVFIFLKLFGVNRFDVKVYYQSNVDSLNRICSTHYPEPYVLPDSVLEKVNWKGTELTLFLFNDQHGQDKQDGHDNLGTEFNRIADTFSETEFRTAKIDGRDLPAGVFARWTSCVFFIAVPWNVVLVDPEKRIRGYYAVNSREEVDRLILEMKIILKKY